MSVLVSCLAQEHSGITILTIGPIQPSQTSLRLQWPPSANPRYSNNNLFSFLSDLQTGPPSHKGITENTAIIAGVVAALVLLVILTLLAVYYINTHPTVAPPFYLMQVRETNTHPVETTGCFHLFKSYPTCALMSVCCLAFSNYCLFFVATHQ